MTRFYSQNFQVADVGLTAGTTVHVHRYGCGRYGVFVGLIFYHAICGAFAPIKPGDPTVCHAIVRFDGGDCEFPIDCVDVIG